MAQWWVNIFGWFWYINKFNMFADSCFIYHLAFLVFFTKSRLTACVVVQIAVCTVLRPTEGLLTAAASISTRGTWYAWSVEPTSLVWFFNNSHRMIDFSWPFMVMNYVVLFEVFHFACNFCLLFLGWNFNLRFWLRLQESESWNSILSGVERMQVRTFFIIKVFSFRVFRRRDSYDFWFVVLVPIFYLSTLQLILFSGVDSRRAFANWLNLWLGLDSGCFHSRSDLLVNNIRS